MESPATDPAGAGFPAIDPAGAGFPGIDPADAAVVAAQLGRPPRGRWAVAHRCRCGLPDVVQTAPRLPDGTPFPTLYYLTCPRASAAVGTLEASGMMAVMTQRLSADEELRGRYLAAHLDYLSRRDAVARACGAEPLPAGTQSAGGMPARVKCLHALVAHELATGVNPIGREAAQAAGEWWQPGPCVARPSRQPLRQPPAGAAQPSRHPPAGAAQPSRHPPAGAAQPSQHPPAGAARSGS